MPFAEWIPAFAGITESEIARISQMGPLPEMAASLPWSRLLYSIILRPNDRKFRSRVHALRRGETPEDSSYDSTKNLFELNRW